MSGEHDDRRRKPERGKKGTEWGRLFVEVLARQALRAIVEKTIEEVKKFLKSRGEDEDPQEDD